MRQIYINSENQQEFISKSYMRARLYRRFMMHSEYMGEEMDYYLKSKHSEASRKDYDAELDKMHLEMTGRVYMLFEIRSITADEMSKLTGILNDLYIDCYLLRFDADSRLSFHKLFEFLLEK